MTQATADLPETAALEQTDEQFRADVLEAFADDTDGSAPTTTPDTEPEASANPESESSTETDTTDENPPSTQEEAVNELTLALRRLDALENNHKKYSDDVHGRVGMLEQVLKAQARTPAGQKVQVKLEDFGEFGSEYPDFAQAQLKVINKALSELEVTGLSPEFITGLKEEARQQAESAATEKLKRERVIACREELDETHPNWRETIGLPDEDVDKGGIPPDTEYRRWLKTQPKEYAERVMNAYSSIVIGRSLDKFADWKKSQQKPRPTSTPTAISSRQQRLAAAVPVRTASTAQKPAREKSGYEAMLEEFNS